MDTLLVKKSPYILKIFQIRIDSYGYAILYLIYDIYEQKCFTNVLKVLLLITYYIWITMLAVFRS
jgi:hypothetical protein